jgi:hypothetical protein
MIMGRFIAFVLIGMVSIYAVEIPLDQQLQCLTLPRGIELWLKELPSMSVVCRFIGHNPRQGRPEIFDQDFALDDFESELPDFLDYCEDEIESKGGSTIGLVAVGPIDAQGLYDFLVERYDQLQVPEKSLYETIQLSVHEGKETDVYLTYPAEMSMIQTDEDVKKLWVFYLIQKMAEGRLMECRGAKKLQSDPKYLLPSIATVGIGAVSHGEVSHLLTQFLQSIQILKEQGFTESELANYKSRLQKHLMRFCSPSSDHQQVLADYYASYLAATLPSPDYHAFMELSLKIITCITMEDIAEMLQNSLLDETRCVAMSFSGMAPMTKVEVQETLNAYPSNSLVFDYKEAQKIALIEGQDAFSQLPITEEEKTMIRRILHTVAKTSLLGLAGERKDLNEKKKMLSHIHPLRSLAVFVSDHHTKMCVAEIVGHWIKSGEFLSDFCGRMQREAERNNLLVYIPGFCQAVRANPDQVRIYINNGDYKGLIDYLIKLNNT